MKTLVWSDIHNRTNLIQSFLEKNGDQYAKRIFLGDYFDSFNDGPDDAARSATLVKKLLADPRNVLLEGNHDTAYRYNNRASHCPGWEREKALAVSDILRLEDWNKFKLFEFEQGFLCSHAGAHFSIIHPVLGIDVADLTKQANAAVEAMRSNIIHPFYAGFNDNGLMYPGLTWLRWYEFHAIPGLNQIVGHTTYDSPQITYARIKKSKYADGTPKETVEEVYANAEKFRNQPPKLEKLCSINYNIDTNNAYFAEIEDGEVSLKLTLDYL